MPLQAIKQAIQEGDAVALKRLLDEDPCRANGLIRWGADNTIQTHPLHFVSDMLFAGALKRGEDLPLIDVLIEAGADLDFQRTPQSDTPLIGAASLGAEDAGIRLLDAGARPELRGIFGESALHWAALLGEVRLAARLIAGSELELKDTRYNSPPLGGRFSDGTTSRPGTWAGRLKWRLCWWRPERRSILCGLSPNRCAPTL